MRKWLPVACVLAVAVLVARADDKPTDASKAFKAMEEEFLKKVRAERDPKAAQELLKNYAKKFLEHAEKNPKDQSAFDSLIYVLRMTQPGKDKDDPGTKSFAAIKQNYAKGKQIAKWLPVLAARGEDGVELLKTVQAEHPDKKVQGKAVKMLKQVREQYAQVADKMQNNENLKKQLEAVRGKEFVKNLMDNAAKYAKEAKDYDKLLQDKYADIFPVVAVGKPAPEVVAQD